MYPLHLTPGLELEASSNDFWPPGLDTSTVRMFRDNLRARRGFRTEADLAVRIEAGRQARTCLASRCVRSLGSMESAIVPSMPVGTVGDPAGFGQQMSECALPGSPNLVRAVSGWSFASSPIRVRQRQHRTASKSQVACWARTLFSPKLGVQATMRWCNLVP